MSERDGYADHRLGPQSVTGAYDKFTCGEGVDHPAEHGVGKTPGAPCHQLQGGLGALAPEKALGDLVYRPQARFLAVACRRVAHEGPDDGTPRLENGARLTSIGKSLPSRRRPARSRPIPIGRGLPNSMKDLRCRSCPARTWSGTRVSTELPTISAGAEPEHGLHGGAGEQDDPVPVDDDDGIRRRLQESGQVVSAF